MPAKKATKGRKQKLTPKLKKLALLMPSVIDGKITLKAAMLKAGYAESSAMQQSQAVGALRNNARMQEALRKAGFTEEVIAVNIMEGIGAERSYLIHEGDDSRIETAPDYDARHKFLRTGAEMLDAFPAKKILDITEDVKTYSDLEGKPKAKTPEEARRIAEDSTEVAQF
jgi:hypothetical protein